MVKLNFMKLKSIWFVALILILCSFKHSKCTALLTVYNYTTSATITHIKFKAGSQPADDYNVSITPGGSFSIPTIFLGYISVVVSFNQPVTGSMSNTPSNSTGTEFCRSYFGSAWNSGVFNSGSCATNNKLTVSNNDCPGF